MSCSFELKREEEFTILSCFYFCLVEHGFWLFWRRVLLLGFIVGTIVPSGPKESVLFGTLVEKYGPGHYFQQGK